VLPHQNPTQALLVNYPLVDVEVTGTTSITWPYDVDLPEGDRLFVWGVRPLSFDGKPWFSGNAGFSKPATFKLSNPATGVSSGEISGRKIHYRFVVVYPEGVNDEEAQTLTKTIGKGFQSVSLMSGAPAKVNGSAPDATGTGSASGNAEGDLALSLVQMLQSVEGFQAGPGVTVIGAKPTPCPPDPCGCKKDNTVTYYCNCTMALGWCACAFCPMYSEIKAMEEEDVTLKIGGRVVPPVKTDTVEVKDVIVVLMSASQSTLQEVKPGIVKALGLVYAARAEKMTDVSAISLKY
jgi:hypothetical protein